ncbi:MAG: signal peptidase I [Nitrospinales bacterium]
MKNKSSEDISEKFLSKTKSPARELTEFIFIVLVLFILFRTFAFQAFKIPSGSMKDTLLIGDHILATKFNYGIHIPNEIPFLRNKLFDDYTLFQKIPERNDIIIFKFPKNEERDFIKRVIGLPGEMIEIRSQKVFIDGKALDENFTRHDEPQGDFLYPRDDLGPFRIPEGHVFVMGDNREYSHDSRFWGVLNLKNIRGKAQLIYWSWDRDKRSVRTDRIGNAVQ